MVVRTVSSIQCSVFKSSAEAFKFPRPLVVTLKQICFFVVFLSTEYWTLNTAQAKDFGTQGVIYPIEEEDPIALIQQKLKVMEERGELERHNKELQKKTAAAVEKPKPVPEITRATESRVFYFDPTYVVQEDLKDHTGRVFAKKGTKINPLETVNLSQNLLFFDGDDPKQKAWVESKFKEGRAKLILIKGTPLGLSEEWNMPVYFDQGGLLTKKLGVRHVPAFVSQENLRLRIEEILLGEKE